MDEYSRKQPQAYAYGLELSGTQSDDDSALLGGGSAAVMGAVMVVTGCSAGTH